VGATGIAYLLYFALIAGAGPSRAILVTYLVPSIALVYGVAFLGEAVTVQGIAGLALVLFGVGLGTGALAVNRRWAARV
jgi:drug/metabolite transporter (DMT)-like permease